MSEPMFGGGTATEERPAPQEAYEAESSGSNRTMLLALGGVVAALVVAGGAFFFLSQSGSSSTDDLVVVPPAAAPPAASAAPSSAPTAVKPASVDVSNRDPFAPLYPSSEASSSPSSNGGGSAAPTTRPTTEPTAAAVELEVTSIDTTSQLATILVDSKKYNKLAVGTTFGTYYTLYSIFNNQCVGVLYGDQSVPVCLGKPVSVTP